MVEESDLLFYQRSFEVELTLAPAQDSEFVMSERHRSGCAFAVEWDVRGNK